MSSRRFRMSHSSKVDLFLADTLATVSFTGGLIIFLISISTSSWVVLDGGAYIGVWNLCLVVKGSDEMDCSSYHNNPDFARASQGFFVVALVCQLACLITLICYTAISHANKIITVICLCLIAFSAGCLTLMGTIVMAVKGKDYLYAMKTHNYRTINNFPSLTNVDLTGQLTVGWSLALAIVSGCFTLIGFGIWFTEYQVLKTAEENNNTR
ncbi:Hypothetical predicted protein [Octopus vulgaris]|uniref:Uncharacterized protein n=2 Tax=Octopus TaxID=6643 RepID=A0AA36B7M6_OCTVU|nr:uncharacterized protein LOC115215862 [Octopus sinensis]CAI9729360.1 Hypothetical predicted protein [Octopus vulgaris]